MSGPIDPSVPADQVDDVWGTVDRSAAAHAPGDGPGITDIKEHDPAPADVVDADIKGISPARSGSGVVAKVVFASVFVGAIAATGGGLWTLYRKFEPAQETAVRSTADRDVEVARSAEPPAPAAGQLAGQAGAAPGTLIGVEVPPTPPTPPAADGQPAGTPVGGQLDTASTAAASAPVTPATPVAAVPATPPQVAPATPVAQAQPVDPAATAPNRQAEIQAAKLAREEAEKAEKASRLAAAQAKESQAQAARDAAKAAKDATAAQQQAERRRQREASQVARRERAEKARLAPKPDGTSVGDQRASVRVAKAESAPRKQTTTHSRKPATEAVESQSSLGIVTAYKIESIHPRTGEHQMAWVRSGNGKLRIVAAGDTLDGMRVISVDATKFSVRTNQGEIR